MRLFARFVGPFAAVLGLTVAFGPAAGATTTGSAVPVTQVASFPTTFSVTSPCDGKTVDTAGHGAVSTTTLGRHTTIEIEDTESGHGYELITNGMASFDSLASKYLVPVSATWIDSAHPFQDFHASFKYTVAVKSKNRPTSFLVSGVTGTCGI